MNKEELLKTIRSLKAQVNFYKRRLRTSNKEIKDLRERCMYEVSKR